MLCEYALNKRDELVHVEDVPNGKSCECHCPYCNEPMIAKNGGKIVEHHFAHFSGVECEGYEETVLHLLAKEIIAEEKCVMLPKYRTLPSELVQFETVEIEERNDNKSIQPDIVGVTKDGLRLHIEIFVTHRVDDDKKRKISDCGYNCLEIQIQRNFECDKNKLKDFLTKSIEHRQFINYPYGDKQLCQNVTIKIDWLKNFDNGISHKIDNCQPKFQIHSRIINKKNGLMFKIVAINNLSMVYTVLNEQGEYYSIKFNEQNQYIDFGKPSNEWTEQDWKEYYGRNKFVK